jgi:cell filamentation protein
MTGRYEAFGPEAEFEPGSRGRALRNRLGITSVRALQQRESEALLATTQQVIDQVTVDQNFTAADICGCTTYGSERSTNGPANIAV